MIPALRAIPAAALLVAGTFTPSASDAAVPATAGARDSAAAMPATPATRDSFAPHALGLGRAAFERSAERSLGVIENLERVAFEPEPTFPVADRAAFLLGEAYLERGSRDRFAALARAVATWRRRSPYTEWIAWRSRLVESAETDSPGTLLGDVGRDTTTQVGRDLIGASILERATRGATSGEDPRPLLATVPSGSRFDGRARHMQGLAALERGALDEGRVALRSLLDGDTPYAARREILLALAGLAMDGSDWEEASAIYEKADREWPREHVALASLGTPADYDSLWASWRGDASLSDAIALDVRPGPQEARRLTLAAAKLDTEPDLVRPTLDAPAPSARFSWPVAPPPADAWRAVARSEHALLETAYELERTRRALEEEARLLAERRRHLAFGRRRAGEEALLLGARAATLDSLQGMLANVAARLRSVKEGAERRIAARTARILERSDDQLLWTHGMRHFHVEGPNRERPIRLPVGVPSPDSLTREEAAVTRAVRAGAERMAAEAPGVIARSYENAWTPRLIARVGTLGAAVHGAHEWAGALAGAIDSSLAAAGESGTLRELAARVTALEQTADSLRTAHEALEARTAAEAVARALARMALEREALDYGLAASAYGLVALAGPADSTGAPPAPADTAAAFDTPEVSARRGAAIARASAFLERHPGSFARGEMRFRLADLEVTDSRQTFRDRMARFTESGQGEVLPVLDYAAPLAIYRAMLAEDSSFAHLDAVLFNAGMLELEASDPGAERSFSDLVNRFPTSPHTQEAYLRLGDMRFAERNYADCIGFYERAAAGLDSSLRTIALYKMGWAHYNEDRYGAAADAFRLVLDLYAANPGAARTVDVEDEAFAYLVHSLARAGGADAFATYFDRIGRRPYELELLMAMGQHFRRFSLYSEAAATDRLSIARFPNDPRALTVAERLIDAQTRANEPGLVREAQTALAEHFAPRSPWAAAQTSDSVRAAGASFARGCWTALALHHRSEGAKQGSKEEWQKALRFDRLLLETWPGDPDAPIVELRAGDASAHLGEHEAALAHFARAAETGKDSTAALALLESVAVTDAWYESTRNARASGSGTGAGARSLGSDSLARAVLRTGDRLLERFTEHSSSADVVWRQGNLAFAHGWNERAATDFERLATRHALDSRAPLAATLKADALFRLERYEAAGTAFEAALEAARRAGRDSLARRAEQALPVCALRLAESAVAADSMDHARHARLFETVATRWPKYEHAHAAQYRAGLAWLKAGRRDDGVRAMRALIAGFPNSEYVRDAYLEIASAFEQGGDHGSAALAYEAFGETYPDDESAGSALLKAAEHFAAAGQEPKADEIRLAYIRKYPGDVETAMNIYEELARRDLARVGPGRTVASLLPAKATPPSHLAEYLRRAALHPELASRPVLAQVRYLEGEEARAACEAVRLTLPLKTSLGVKKQHLESAIARYRQSIEIGATEWAHASAFRIGETLVGFGEGLTKSERPADLAGDDLLAYDEVLNRESRGIFDRGEDVWMELLRQNGAEATEDEWIKQAREALWPRLGQRFLFRPEMEFPLVTGSAPGVARNAPTRGVAEAGDARGLAEQGGSGR